MGEKGVKYLEKVPTFFMDGPKSASIGNSNRACMMQHITHSAVDKVEKILKGSLDSILSLLPSVKIQIMGGKVCLRCKSKTLLGNGHCQQTFKIKSLLTPPSNGLPHYLKLTFPPIIFALKCDT